MAPKFSTRNAKWQWLLDVAHARGKSPNQLYTDIAVDGAAGDEELQKWFDIYNADHRPMPKGLLWGSVPVSQLAKRMNS